MTPPVVPQGKLVSDMLYGVYRTRLSGKTARLKVSQNFHATGAIAR